jgi:hypothetical protein
MIAKKLAKMVIENTHLFFPNEGKNQPVNSAKTQIMILEIRSEFGRNLATMFKMTAI